MRPDTVSLRDVRYAAASVDNVRVELLRAAGTLDGEPVTLWSNRRNPTEPQHWDTDPARVADGIPWGFCRRCQCLVQSGHVCEGDGER